MKHIKASMRSFIIQTALIFIIFVTMAAINGHLELAIPFAAGGFVYVACWIASGYKMLSSDKVTPKKAKKSLFISLQVRLVAMFLTLLAAMKAGEAFFWAAVAGLFCMFVLLMANAMVCSYKDGRH
jgi:Ca2+/Na+ antiporter